jgi:hypothetical protein
MGDQGDLVRITGRHPFQDVADADPVPPLVGAASGQAGDVESHR